MKKLLLTILTLVLLFTQAIAWGASTQEIIGRQLQGISLRHYQHVQSLIKYKTKIAVVDTGIDFNNPLLANKIYLPGKRTPSSRKFGVDFSAHTQNRDLPFDTNGHGTHVSGIIVNINPHVELLIVKYFNPSDSEQEGVKASNAALRYAIAENVDVINYSGGGPYPSEEERSILEEAEKKGILVITSAGNYGENLDQAQHKFYPASYNLDNFINVAATDFQNQLIKETNYGKSIIHLSAPGKNILSNLPKNRLGQLSGSSQATAFVTAIASIIKGIRPDLKASAIKQIILGTIKKIPSHQAKTLTEGILNPEGALAQVVNNFSLAQ